VTWLVTGAQGMLGTDVRRSLAETGIEHSAVDRDDFDLTDPQAVAKAVAGHDVVVNCAAWTAVDLAETREAEAFEINATAAGLLARAAQAQGALIVHVSTDYVFAGDAGAPYDEDAPLRPRSAYGRTKAAGEWAVRAEAPERHLILRTGWLYGAKGTCFPRTIARVAWHATSSGETTWCGFAREVVAAAGLSPDIVRPISSTALSRDAARPAYSVLGHNRLTRHGFEPIGPWSERWSAASSEVLWVDEPE
jgi:dTDP-4-dehydrorhamnose reductase